MFLHARASKPRRGMPRDRLSQPPHPCGKQTVSLSMITFLMSFLIQKLAHFCMSDSLPVSYDRAQLYGP
jgi:hypothetical protein